jgi:MoxR-like ATPase
MQFKGTKNYIATEDLSMAVNASMALERPLLIKGEPGTGKTLLAVELQKLWIWSLLSGILNQLQRLHRVYMNMML